MRRGHARNSRFLAGIGLIVLSVLLVGGIAAAAVRAVRHTPAVDTGVPFTEAPEPQKTVPPEETFERSPEEPGGYNFLCCGTDVTTGLSDTVILVHLSADGTVCGVQLPRDTYIKYDGTDSKLNACVRRLGIRGAADVLEKALCIRIDYTVSVTTDAFAAAVDAVGGVEADVPFAMDYDDPYQDLHIHIPAGRQVLDGRAAEGFVRYRSGYADGDLGRLDAQKAFLFALLRTVRQNLTAESTAKIVADVFPKITADVPLADCLYFVRTVMAGGLGAEGLSLMTAPGRALWTEETGTSYYVLGRAAMRDAVNRFLNVYGTEVPDRLFDRERVFVRDGVDDFERIYTYAIITPETVTGE